MFDVSMEAIRSTIYRILENRWQSCASRMLKLKKVEHDICNSGALNWLEAIIRVRKFEREQKLLTVPFYFIPFVSKDLADGKMAI